MRTERIITALTVAFLVGSLPVRATSQVPSAAPAAGGCERVKYVERPEGGPNQSRGRALSGSGNASYGVDIDSRVEIVVDGECLRRTLAPVSRKVDVRRVAILTNRLKRLNAATRMVPGLVAAFQEAVDAHGAARAAGNPAASYDAIERFVELRQPAFDALLEVMTERIAQQRSAGLSPTAPRLRAIRDSAARIAEEEMGAVVTSRSGYDWARFGELLQREVSSAQYEIQSIAPATMGMAIEAHLVTAEGRVVPVYLPRYNSAETGPETRFTRVEFATSPEQSAMYAQYAGLARSMKESRSAGEAAMQLLQQQYALVRTDLGPAIDAVGASAASGKASLDALGSWSQPARRTQWRTLLAGEVGASAEGKALLATWDTVSRTIDSLQRDVAAYRTLASLKGQLDGQDALAGMNIILNVLSTLPLGDRERASGGPFRTELWAARGELLQRFVTRAEALPQAVRASTANNGPIADLKAAATALHDIRQTVASLSPQVTEWFVRAMAGGVARAAAELVPPPDQRVLPLDGDLNTVINLRTIPAKRAEGDRVEVGYRFFESDTVIRSAGWRDDLRMRAYGFLARSVAGLAFTRQVGGDGTFTPTASLSWLATYRCWPGQGGVARVACPRGGSESGLGSNMRAFGVGFSTMSLNFDEAQKVQIGVAGTVSTLDDRVLAGFGRNLQARDNPWFWFFSVRLFSASGALGGQ